MLPLDGGLEQLRPVRVALVARVPLVLRRVVHPDRHRVAQRPVPLGDDPPVQVVVLAAPAEVEVAGAVDAAELLAAEGHDAAEVERVGDAFPAPLADGGGEVFRGGAAPVEAVVVPGEHVHVVEDEAVEVFPELEGLEEAHVEEHPAVEGAGQVLVHHEYREVCLLSDEKRHLYFDETDEGYVKLFVRADIIGTPQTWANSILIGLFLRVP